MVFLAAWFLIKRFKKKSSDAAPHPDEANRTQAARMPRIGTPGTVTKDQRERLRAKGFEPSKHWSIEEADLVLDTVVYLRGVWNKAVSKQTAPVEIQNHLLAYILTDTEMREYIRRWSTENKDKDSGSKPAFPRTKIFERVASEALRIKKKVQA
jgi:hypothetical protein